MLGSLDCCGEDHCITICYSTCLRCAYGHEILYSFKILSFDALDLLCTYKNSNTYTVISSYAQLDDWLVHTYVCT